MLKSIPSPSQEEALLTSDPALSTPLHAVSEPTLVPAPLSGNTQSKTAVSSSATTTTQTGGNSTTAFPFVGGIVFPFCDAKGKPAKHWINTKLVFEKYGISVRYNELTKVVEFDYPPYQTFSADSVLTDFRGICTTHGYTISKSDAADHIALIAEQNRFHPIKDYLTGCQQKWDGISRTKDLFNMLILDREKAKDPGFLFSLFVKWLITCVKLVFNDGTIAAQGVLVIVGSKGIGKTRFGTKLIPNFSWIKTGMVIDSKNKDTVIQALGYWIVELGEFGRNLSASNGDSLKAFVTNANDTFRHPYGRKAERHPRTTVFYATADNNEFLKDDAGERRFWVIPITGINDQINIDIDQLWGEIAYLALVKDEPHWLTQPEIIQLNTQNEEFKQRSNMYEFLHESLDWDAPLSAWTYRASKSICNELEIGKEKMATVGRALTQMRFMGVVKKADNTHKEYLLPPVKPAPVRFPFPMQVVPTSPAIDTVGRQSAPQLKKVL